MAVGTVLEIDRFAADHKLGLCRGLRTFRLLLRVMLRQRSRISGGYVAMVLYLGGALALLERSDHRGQQRFGLPVEMGYSRLEAEAISAMAFATITDNFSALGSLDAACSGTEQQYHGH